MPSAWPRRWPWQVLVTNGRRLRYPRKPDTLRCQGPARARATGAPWAQTPAVARDRARRPTWQQRRANRSPALPRPAHPWARQDQSRARKAPLGPRCHQVGAPLASSRTGSQVGLGGRCLGPVDGGSALPGAGMGRTRCRTAPSRIAPAWPGRETACAVRADELPAVALSLPQRWPDVVSRCSHLRPYG